MTTKNTPSLLAPGQTWEQRVLQANEQMDLAVSEMRRLREVNANLLAALKECRIQLARYHKALLPEARRVEARDALDGADLAIAKAEGVADV